MVGLGRSKKGSIQDILLIGVITFFFAVVLLISFVIGSRFNDQIQLMPQFSAEAKDSSTRLVGMYPGVLDNMFIPLLVFLSVGALMLASMVRIHPVFIPIFIIFLVVIIVVCGVLSNAYGEMASNSMVSAYADQFTFISFVLTYLPFIIGVVGILLMIVMYKAWQGAQ